MRWARITLGALAASLALLTATAPASFGGRRRSRDDRDARRRARTFARGPNGVGQPGRPLVRVDRRRRRSHRSDRRPARRSDLLQPDRQRDRVRASHQRRSRQRCPRAPQRAPHRVGRAAARPPPAPSWSPRTPSPHPRPPRRTRWPARPGLPRSSWVAPPTRASAVASIRSRWRCTARAPTRRWPASPRSSPTRSPAFPPRTARTAHSASAWSFPCQRTSPRRTSRRRAPLCNRRRDVTGLLAAHRGVAVSLAANPVTVAALQAGAARRGAGPSMSCGVSPPPRPETMSSWRSPTPRSMWPRSPAPA